MPQFDNSIFLSEFFYLFLSFSFFYFYLLIFNKVVILRASFFRKTWLFFLILRSKSLIIKYNKRLKISNLFYCYSKLFKLFNNNLNSILNNLNYLNLGFVVLFNFLTYILNIKLSFIIYSRISIFLISF